MNLLSARRTRRISSFKPALETLDDRCLLSAGVGVSGTTLNITGTKAGDVIHVQDKGTNAPGALVVTVGNQSAQSINASVITAVNIDTGRGNDKVTYDFIGDVSVSRQIKIDLGAGDDNCNVHFLANLKNGNGITDLNLKILGKAGDDSIQVDASQNVALGGALLEVEMDGGFGKDSLSFNYNGVLKGRIIVETAGGDGKDTINVQVKGQVEPGTKGRVGLVDARMDGGLGDDNLTMNLDPDTGIIFNDLIVPIEAESIIQGGLGHDTCTHRAADVVHGCEVEHLIS